MVEKLGKRVLVIGLDCAPPELLFDLFADELPNIKRMLDNGVYARMESSHPPITIPAWMVMATSKNAGKLGVYGFRHRKPGTYNKMWLANSHSIREKTVWDILGEHNKKVVVVGVPPAYPPKPVNGSQISCFMTPGADKDYTYPQRLKKEIERLIGEYLLDIVFRTDEKDKLLQQLYDMTKQHFTVLKYLAKTKPWHFFMFVEIGVDRVHHAFWKFFDKKHHLYEPDNKYEDVILNYYRLVDREIGKLLELTDDNTSVILVSDHGAKSMKGAFCINQWLAENGYLTFKKIPPQGSSLAEADIDWAKTQVWGWGGYHARIFFNVKGREPQGVIEPENYESFREQVISDLKVIQGPNSEKWNTKVYTPEEIYPDGIGDYPDLTVYFDDLNWRSAGTLGYDSYYLSENDKGPDDAVHSQKGVFIYYDPKRDAGGERIKDLSLLDFAPTVLKVIGVPTPKDMEGKIIKEVT
ncbi:MAG: alkaline phosphatase family protein [Candidatus Bathyarchaeota archaeon]|nr:MAG: alkaline phosphatase family protein [Candidatus Bathyarchaeota archaeon]